MALKQIKNKIVATKKTGQVTKAMEAVSAVKMRKSQERALSGRPFAEAAFRILNNIAHSPSARDHDFFKEGYGTHECIIVITSDKGLAGSLNSAVLKEAEAIVRRIGKKEHIEIIAFGRKAFEYFNNRGYTIAHQYINVSDDVDVTDMEETADAIIKGFVGGKYHTVSIVYQNFISTFEQKPTTHQVLPINPEQVKKIVEDIIPAKGEYSENVANVSEVSYTAEQSRDDLYGAIFGTIVEIMLYHALLENKACEHSARMVAMKNATDKSKEMVKSLTLVFNKARQAAITAEVSEITGGIEAMK
jgi:F-type H+-transporting ATPase subunit gamma